MTRVLIVPDTQVKPGVEIAHFRWIARAIKDYKPTHVVHLGDHWDFPSLSSYSSRKEIEGKRVIQDIAAGNAAMELFWKTLKGLKHECEFHFVFGNHENRLERYLGDNVILEGVLGMESLNTEGWITHPFRTVFDIENVWITHYFYNQFTSRAYGGTAHSVLKNVGLSLIQGHRQGKDIAARSLPNGKVQRALIAGYTFCKMLRGVFQFDVRLFLVIENTISGRPVPAPSYGPTPKQEGVSVPADEQRRGAAMI